MKKGREQTQRWNDAAIIAYLLGELSTEEAALFEEAVFYDEEFAEQVFALEEELIDNYVWARMPAPRQAHFEQNYLVNEQRLERVKFAAAFRQHVQPAVAVVTPREAEASNRRWSFALFPRLAFAVLLIAALLFGWQWLTRRPSTGTDREVALVTPTPLPAETLAPTQTASPNQTPAPSPQATVRTSGPELASVRLLPDVHVMGPGQSLPQLVLRPQTKLVELKLIILSQDYSSYRATLETDTGTTVWTGQTSQLRPGPRGSYEVIVRLPVQTLRTGGYKVLLAGAVTSGQLSPNVIGDYLFRVSRR